MNICSISYEELTPTEVMYLEMGVERTEQYRSRGKTILHLQNLLTSARRRIEKLRGEIQWLNTELHQARSRADTLQYQLNVARGAADAFQGLYREEINRTIRLLKEEKPGEK